MKPNIKVIAGGMWKFYEDPRPEYTYVMGVDTASGKEGANETVAHILCVNTGKQVITSGGQYAPEDFCGQIEMAAYLYNEACIGVEREFHGVTIINYLRQKLYPNIYFHPSHLTAFNGAPTEFGWDARRYRQIAIDWLQQDIGYSVSKVPMEQDRAIWLKDPETITQLGYFWRNKKTGKFEAPPGKRDDRVSALYIANYIRREVYPLIFAVEAPKEKEMTFLERIQQGDKAEDRNMGRRDLDY